MKDLLANGLELIWSLGVVIKDGFFIFYLYIYIYILEGRKVLVIEQNGDLGW